MRVAQIDNPLLPAELELWKPEEDLDIGSWAEKYRYVTDGPIVGDQGTPVLWSNDTFPLQLAIMGALESSQWSTVAVLGPPQAGGKTDCAAVNSILKKIHHNRQDAIYVSANAAKAYDQWHKKFEAAILASPELAELRPENRDDVGTKERRDFDNGCSLFFAGAESIANVSSSTIPNIVCDDVQAMPNTIGALGHPCDVAFKRSGAMPEEDCMLVLLGTAGHVSDYLWRALERSSFFRPYVPCPSCGAYQLIEWERMQFDQADSIAAHADCYLQCVDQACDYHITFEDLPRMLRVFKWVARGQTIDRHGRIKGEMPRTRLAGFWWNAMYWPFVPWGVYAARWVESRGDPDKEKDFQQHVSVIAWQEAEDDENVVTVAEVASHMEREHRWGIVPAEANLLTLTADVHDRYIYYIIRAWRKQDGTSWLVDAGHKGVHGLRKNELLSEAQRRSRVGHGIRAALEDLWSMESKGWPIITAAGEAKGIMRAGLCLVDGGYRPDAVGQFCHLRNAGLPVRKWRMIHGKSESKGASRIWNPQARRNKRGHVWHDVGVAQAKHMLRELLVIPAGQPGRWYTYSDRDLDSYHRHMVSEHFVPKKSGKKVWEKRKGAGPNHWWDNEVYQIAAAIACGVRLPSLITTTTVKVNTSKHTPRRRPIRRKY